MDSRIFKCARLETRERISEGGRFDVCLLPLDAFTACLSHTLEEASTLPPTLERLADVVADSRKGNKLAETQGNTVIINVVKGWC